ncbi:MAG: flocculation-associated PEP-CTERM protein PepA [Sulfuriferula sp.]
MKKIATLVGASLLAAIALPSTASAYTFLDNWQLSVAGGGANLTTINQYVDLVGASYVQNTPTGGGNFTFKENGAFVLNGHDGGSTLPNTNQVTATFLGGAGTGKFGSSINFTAGTLNVYSDTNFNFATANGNYGAGDGTLIGTFNIYPADSTGSIDPNGIPNGQLTLAFTTSYLEPGYFYNSVANGGGDLTLTDYKNTLLGFATTNASANNNPSAPVISDIVGGLAGASATYTNIPPNDFVIGNNGQYRLATVPEPASLALFGIGLLGMGLGLRKRS